MFGTRGQVGGVMSLLNLRLDFVLLSAFAGPAVLGVYAVASKFAELVRVFGMALQYVLYPKYANDGSRAMGEARGLMVRVGLLSTITIVPLWITCGYVIPGFYGSAFNAAVMPTRIILLGLVLDGVGGVITAVFYGVGRPGLNSLAMGAGLAVTVVLDVLLIPRFSENGAAVASALAYTTTGLVLIGFFWSLERSLRPATRNHGSRTIRPRSSPRWPAAAPRPLGGCLQSEGGGPCTNERKPGAVAVGRRGRGRDRGRRHLQPPGPGGHDHLYVARGNPACSNAGPGTSAKPYCTISAAAEKVTPGRPCRSRPAPTRRA